MYMHFFFYSTYNDGDINFRHEDYSVSDAVAEWLINIMYTRPGSKTEELILLLLYNWSSLLNNISVLKSFLKEKINCEKGETLSLTHPC